ncbi:Hypothetical protein R9X50_00181900 [Acrodontium crateriforme]|uniref:J domain-containing protein n=1 Tax=Acrodontium crateriforme TaxID=150365 RepID=A0AAQ3M2Q1_9PEZI|nr:Hypothetical protein R9X50_00181900 [Acrodontium crateriforme]
MADPLPPDPYLALGVAKDASSGAIKTQYRKLVLKFHPDKVKDASQKDAAADQFHKIQTAYEIIGDDDRRARYDAQCKLAELRKEVMERHGAKDAGARPTESRSAPRTPPVESPRASYFYSRPSERSDRVTPQYEERKPAGYSDPEYTESSPRATARKDPLSDRTTKRGYTRETKERERSTTKKSQRATRDERSRKTDREIKRDREHKSSHTYMDEPTSSDSDRYEAQSRKMREEDAELKRARAAFYDPPRKSKDEPTGYVPYDSDELSRKLYSQYDGAREYMERARRTGRPGSESRPEPVRQASLKDKLTSYVTGIRPPPTRTDSVRPKPTAGRDTEIRRSERRPSVDIVEEPRRAPALNKAYSSPVDIRIPAEKKRAQSVQIDAKDLPPDSPPRIRRAETMPVSREREREARPETRRQASNQPPRSSGLRQAEFPTGATKPATASEWTEPPTNKYRHYGQQYADDVEYPTPEGYRTEVREPSAPSRSNRYTTRSPSPVRERGSRGMGDRLDRERSSRTAAARYSANTPPGPSAAPRTTSHSYAYKPGVGVTDYVRPALSRENSTRAPVVDSSLLYGEVRTTRSPKQAYSKYSPPDSTPTTSKYTREVRPEDLRPSTGYDYVRRPGQDSRDRRPSYSRQTSGTVPYVK